MEIYHLIQAVDGIPAKLKSTQTVQSSSKARPQACAFEKVHQYLVNRKNTKPAVIGVNNFPDLSGICGCNASLLLKSVDICQKDFSRELCSLLGFYKSYLYIESDGLTKKGVSRLLSLLTSSFKLFDNRVTIVILAEKKLNVDVLGKLMEKEFDFMDSNIHDSRLKKTKASASLTDMKKHGESLISLKEPEKKGEKGIDELIEEVSDKDIEIKKLKEQVERIQIKSEAEKEFSALKIKELQMNVVELSSSQSDLQTEVKDLERKLSEKNENNQNLRDKLKESIHCYEELVAKNQELQTEANNLLVEKVSNIQQLEEKQEYISRKEESFKELETKYKKLESMCFSKELELKTQKSDNDLEVENGPNMRVLQGVLKNNREKFPSAGSGEIVRRSIKSFKCEEKFSELVAGEFECCITVTGGVVLKIASMLTFKGTGKSKKKAKNSAFDNYLSMLLNYE